MPASDESGELVRVLAALASPALDLRLNVAKHPQWTDGAYALFRAPVTGTRQGKTVLVQLREFTDPETGGRYTVKRYESEKAGTEDSWEHTRIALKPANPAFEPIVLDDASEGTVQVVAELLEVGV